MFIKTMGSVHFKTEEQEPTGTGMQAQSTTLQSLVTVRHSTSGLQN
jgi:hypothetical protein